MSDRVEDAGQPPLSDQVQEMQARFANDAALQDAMGKLTLAGFDHADLSLPDPQAPADTPDGAAAASDSIDKTQLRTMASGMTGAAAGIGVAGVLLATGGLAAPVVAAIGGASALGAVAATTGAGVAVDNADVEARDRLGAEGNLILAVRIRSPEMASKAETALRESGGTDIAAIRDVGHARTRGVSSASWTG